MGDVEEEVFILANGGEQEIRAFEALVKQCDRNRLAAGFKASRELPGQEQQRVGVHSRRGRRSSRLNALDCMCDAIFP